MGEEKSMKWILLCTAALAGMTALAVWNYRRFRGKVVDLTGHPYEIDIRDLCYERAGKKIYGQLLLPKGKSGKLPTVICSHGLNSSYGNTEYMIGKSLAQAGFAVYCYDFCGGSLHSKSQGEPSQMSVFTEKEDLNVVMDGVKSLPMVDTEQLFLFGESQGGFVSAITANERAAEIKAMALYYPAFCIPADARKRYPNLEAIPEKMNRHKSLMGRIYHEKLFTYDVYEHISGFTKPVLIIQGDKDPVVKGGYSERACSIYSDARLDVLPGQKHGFDPSGTEKAAHLVYDFLMKQMKPQNCFTSEFGSESVMKHNTLMNGITSTRGEAMGFVQTDTLSLHEDHTFELVKELKSTKKNIMMKKPVHVQYTFTGTYKEQGDTIILSEALKGHGTVDWGTFSNFLDTGDGEYDSEGTPGVLSLYPTAFFVENCKNVPMTAYLDRENHTFSLEEFEPVILSAEEAGIVHREQKLNPKAGLMKASLVENPSCYSLKEEFVKKEMKVGTCINTLYLEEPYASLVKAQFNSVTLENHLKPNFVLSQEKSRETGHLSVEFSEETKKLLNWCKENGLPVRGHTLIWYMGIPGWVYHEGFASDAANVGREELLKRMEDFIKGFFAALDEGGWSEVLYCLDVVNEAVIAPGEIRKLPWQEIIGDDYIWYAYHYARKYAPANIRLAYNDFDLEAKTDKVIELVNGLKEQDGTPLVDIIGQQGHYGAYSSIDTLMDALERIGTETGCELQVTELDVSVSRQGTEEELKLQGRFYYQFVQKILSLREKGINITGITLWGFADSLSWMPSGYLHLYDRNLVPKYAYFGMLGKKELAGFDGTEEMMEESHFESMKFVAEDDTEKYILLQEDGTFLDMTTGARITGTYRFDGVSTYMLVPQVGGYVNLTLTEDGQHAERVEAAGARMQLRRGLI